MNHEEIKDLIRTFTESDLTSFRYDTDEVSLSLKRQSKRSSTSGRREEEATISVPMPQEVPAGSAAAPKKETADESGRCVSAPIAGVFYRAAKPGAEPYVREGSEIHKGQTLGLMEAMKLMSEIPSPCDGIVRSIPVKNGEFAEYGRTLMVIEEKHV